jgi:hypothetical protein
MAQHAAVAGASPAPAAVLSKAAVRASQRLALNQAQLSRILGLSTATVSRLAAGSWALAPDTKAWELATVLVRITRSLDAITGGKSDAMRDWLHSDNAAFSMPPAQRMLGAEGLIDVLHYLDAARSRT